MFVAGPERREEKERKGEKEKEKRVKIFRKSS